MAEVIIPQEHRADYVPPAPALEGDDAPAVNPNLQFKVEDGRLYESHSADVEPVLEHAKALHNEWGGKSPTGELYHVAHVPKEIVLAYIHRNNITLGEFLNSEDHANRMLSDPAISAFRIWKGAL